MSAILAERDRHPELVFKLSIDLGRVPDAGEVAAIVDEAILPALGL